MEAKKKLFKVQKKIAEEDLPAVEVTVWFSSIHKRYSQKNKDKAIAYIHDMIKDQIDEIEKMMDYLRI